MRLGALLGPIVDASDSKRLVEQATEYAAEGYQSLWSAQAIGRGFMVSDPFIALAAAAAVTEDLELGTAIVQVPLYHPMDLAHRVYSLQQLCAGRFIFGVGAGSTEQDFLAYERDYGSRFADFSLSMNDLREIFADGGQGERSLHPWSAVQGGPPLFFGTWGNGVQRAATEFDGWIASGHYRTVDEVCEALARYRDSGGGRAIVSTLIITAETDLGEFAAKLARFDEAGFDDAVIMLQPGAPSAAEVRKLLD